MNSILLMDQFLSSLQLQALEEGIMHTIFRSDLISFMSNKYTQEVLSLFLIFDEFSIFQRKDMANENRIKILEDEGLIKYLPLPIDYPNFVIREGNSGFIEASYLKDFIMFLEKDYYLRNLLVKDFLANFNIAKLSEKKAFDLEYIEDIKHALKLRKDKSVTEFRNLSSPVWSWDRA